MRPGMKGAEDKHEDHGYEQEQESIDPDLSKWKMNFFGHINPALDHQMRLNFSTDNEPQKPLAKRLCRNSKKRLFCACHAGPDPASSSVRLCKTHGFRVKPGMTKTAI